MAAIPSSTETVQDPGLGIAGAVSNIPVVVGYSSTGTANSYKRYSSINTLVSERGQGPAVEFAAELLAVTGGPVGFVTSSTSVAAAIGTVTQTGADTLLVASGTPTNDFNVLVEIVAGGALGTATFKYTLDNYSGSEAAQRTYSPVITVPSGGSYLLPSTGITITFAGTQTAGNVHSFVAGCAAMNTTDLNTAMAAVDATSTDWRFVCAVTSNENGDPTTGAGLAAALQSQLNTMATNSKYRAGMIAACKDDADPESDFAAVVADRLLIDYGKVRHISAKPFVGYGYVDQIGTISYAMRAAGSVISTDLKRVSGNGLQNGGPLPNVVKLFKDERIEATGLDDIKISTLRTYDGRPGFFITQGRIKSALGSDFVYWPLRIIMDVACETAHQVQTGFIGRGVRTNSDGSIDERDALRLESEVQSVLDARLTSPRSAEGTPGHVSAVVYSIDRTNNVNTTSTIIAEVAIRPLGYIDYITTTLGFSVNVGGEEAEEA